MPSAAHLRQSHLAQLNHLLQVCAQGNAFYRVKMGDLLDHPLEELEAYRHFPTTTKQELLADQAAHPPWGSNLSYPAERYCRFHQTSGSTGQPMRWLDTAESWAWMVSNWVKVFGAAGVDDKDRVLFAFSFGPFLGFWTAFDAATQLNSLALPAGGLSTLARLRMLESNQATVVCCTPTYALRMGEEAKARGISLESVRRVIVAGEPGGSIPETRQQIETLWGATVVDHHGMTEVGPVSYGLPEHPHILRIIESGYLAEILDPTTGEPVPPGREGELVLTTLGRVGSPLLRYRTGDLVRGWTGCPEHLAPYHLDGGILSRIDDMIQVRGVNVYPSAVERIVRGHAGVMEYRVNVSNHRGMTELGLEIETDGSEAHLAETLQEELKAAFSLRVPVETVSAGRLPRFEMKAKRWVVQ